MIKNSSSHPRQLADRVVLVTHKHCPDGELCKHLVTRYLNTQPRSELTVLEYAAGSVDLDSICGAIECSSMSGGVYAQCDLVMADVCLKSSNDFYTLLQRNKNLKRIIVIEHHPIALDMAKKLSGFEYSHQKNHNSDDDNDDWRFHGTTLRGAVEWCIDFSKSASELCFRYLWPNVPFPLSVCVVGDVDLHRPKEECTCLQSYELSAFLTQAQLNNSVGFDLLDASPPEIISGFVSVGKKLIDNEKRICQGLKLKRFDFNDDGGRIVKSVAVESSGEWATRLADVVFEKKAYSDVEMVVVYYFMPSKRHFKFCLRSKWDCRKSEFENQRHGRINVDHVARKFQGGGHAAAAGFRIESKQKHMVSKIFPVLSADMEDKFQTVYYKKKFQIKQI